MRTEKHLIEQINGYLKLAEQEQRKYSLEQIGLWEVFGGDGGDGVRKELGIYHGRFLDVVATAVQNYYFVAPLNSSQIHRVRGSTRHIGYIVPYVALQIRNLERKIEQSDLENKVES